MKNYLYHFEFFSGFYEAHFYQQIQANDEKDAILQIVAIFNNTSEEDSLNFLNSELGENWTTVKFWSVLDHRFFDGSEGYTLHWIKEIDFDLNRVGK